MGKYEGRLAQLKIERNEIKIIINEIFIIILNFLKLNSISFQPFEIIKLITAVIITQKALFSIGSPE